jgi:thiosulfate/3-mercaptopyruvate sulfurtransferase
VTDIVLEELVRRLAELPLLDVRTTREYDGSAGQPCDPRQGHIPGARNLDVYRLMELTTEEVRTELALEPGAELIAYCHSGARSAIATQLLRSLGYDARNYVGSWHEWSRHDDLPIESSAAVRNSRI